MLNFFFCHLSNKRTNVLLFFSLLSSFLTAQTNSSESIWKNIIINEVSAAGSIGFSDNNGEHEDWIELYNSGNTEVNLKGLYLSDSKQNLTKYQILQDIVLKNGEYLLIWADEEPEEEEEGVLHADFKLDAEGETIILADSNLVIIDVLDYPEMIYGTTFGRLTHSVTEWRYFDKPTPKKNNPESGASAILDAPRYDVESGFYDHTINLNLSASDPNTAQIRYTTDGSVPTNESLLYTSSISVSENSAIRFRAFPNNSEFLPSRVISKSYYMDVSAKLDVISLIGNSETIENWKRTSSSDEIFGHIEYFGKDHKLKFSVNAGIEKHSNKNREQVPFRISARDDYGNKTIDYQIFKDKPIYSFKRLILRNSGNDCFVSKNTVFPTQIRDAFHHTVFAEMGHSKQMASYKPVSLYINGKYNGIYNIRERIDKFFISSNYGYEGKMDLLEKAFNYAYNRYAIEGSFKLYDSLRVFSRENDISADSNFNYLNSYIDTDQLIDYWLMEVYIGNYDWLSNNIKIYRPDVEGAKFKYILWDTDHGSGLKYKNYYNPTWSTLSWSLSTTEQRTGGGSNNLLMRKLLTNQSFKNKLINRYADLLNSLFLPENMHSIFDSLVDNITPDMPLHMEKWGVSENTWNQNITQIRSFYGKRPTYVRNDIKRFFKLDSIYSVSIKTNDQESGTVKINSITPDFTENSWNGFYFTNVPILLEAIPKRGFKFSHWSDNADFGETRLVDSIVSDTSFYAYFVPSAIDSNAVIINEIMLNDEARSGLLNSDELNWVEIKNISGIDIKLNGWKITSLTDTVLIEDYTIKNGEYLLISNQNKRQFNRIVKNIVTDKEFLLKSDDMICIFNHSGRMVDSVSFSSSDFPSELPFSYNFSMELITETMDNSLAGSWKACTFIGGTPAEENSLFHSGLMNVKINELMAENNGVILDNFSEADDWIELYNTHNSEVLLSGLFISDDKYNPVKYQIFDEFNNLTIAPKSYQILWADDDDNQGALHLNFKLSEKGEEICLYVNNGYDLLKIDEIEYSKSIANKSFGAYYDGINSQATDLVFLDPSPAYPNMDIPVNIIAIENKESHISIFPNPASDIINILLDEISVASSYQIEIIDMMGQSSKLFEAQNAEQLKGISINDLCSGMYYVRITNSEGTIYTNKFIKQ